MIESFYQGKLEQLKEEFEKAVKLYQKKVRVKVDMDKEHKSENRNKPSPVKSGASEEQQPDDIQEEGRLLKPKLEKEVSSFSSTSN